MKVLVACEFSGIVRDAFTVAGHDAMSCDLLPSERPGLHFQGDVRDCLSAWGPWDLMVAFPPCTHLAASGARWWRNRPEEQAQAMEFARSLWAAPITRIAIENPIGRMSHALRQPDQIVQPWQFGHGETKATCLWLKGLRKLEPTHTAAPSFFWREAPAERVARVHREPPSPRRWKNRSRTYPGIAAAMAAQWAAA